MLETQEAPKPRWKWPERGTPEYDAHIAKIKAGQQRSKQEKRKQPGRPKVVKEEVMPSDDLELIDLGDPENVSVPRAPSTAKPPSATSRRGKDWKLEEPTVRDGVEAAFAGLALMTGHEHWTRSPEECKAVSVPLTRIINRLDPKVLDKVLKHSDPLALAYGLTMIAGPSLMREWNDWNTARSGQPRQRPQPRQGPPRQAGGGHQRSPEQPAADVSTNGSDFPAADPEILAVKF